MSRQPVGNDNDQNSADQITPPSLMGDLVMGLRFFSRLPSGSAPHQLPQMGRMVPALGLTSVIIGVFPALVFLGANILGLPILLSVCLGGGAQVIVTGAMAEDGLADSVDGLWGGQSPKQRLDIMKDSTHGTYGVLALILLVAIRVLAIAALATSSILAAAMLWIGAQIIARQSALWLVLVLPNARDEGIAKSAGTLSKTAFIMGAAISFLIVLAFTGIFIGFFGLIITAAFVALIVVLWNRICKKLIGGYSGDLIGGLQALVEIGALCSFILVV